MEDKINKIWYQMNMKEITSEQAKKDKEQYDRYLIEMEDERPEIVRKSFKEMFGYEIILFESGGYELRGERFS